MSEGPIKQERRAHVTTFASTADVHRVCMAAEQRGRGYCGREAKGAKVTTDWTAVECTDCEAARRADEEAAS